MFDYVQNQNYGSFEEKVYSRAIAPNKIMKLDCEFTKETSFLPTKEPNNLRLYSYYITYKVKTCHEILTDPSFTLEMFSHQHC